VDYDPTSPSSLPRQRPAWRKSTPSEVHHRLTDLVATREVDPGVDIVLPSSQVWPPA
jgi:hypothetical protein